MKLRVPGGAEVGKSCANLSASKVTEVPWISLTGGCSLIVSSFRNHSLHSRSWLEKLFFFSNNCH